MAGSNFRELVKKVLQSATTREAYKLYGDDYGCAQIYCQTEIMLELSLEPRKD